MRLPRGFSLIEMVVTIVVLGIIAVTAGAFLLPAFNAHQAMERRAALVEAAESAIRRMSRDIRIAVPNSVRTTSGPGFAIELIPTVDGARYCTSGTADCDTLPLGGDVLTIGTSDSAFDVLGCFRNADFLTAALDPASTTAYRLAIGNPAPTDVLNPDNAIYTATGNTAVISRYLVVSPIQIQLTIVPDVGGGCGTLHSASSYRRHRVTLSAGHTFPIASPRQRVFVIRDSEAPVTYICNAGAGTLTRYAGYKSGTAYSTASQPTDPTSAPLSGATGRLVANNVTACSATSTEANVQTSGVVTLSLTLSNLGETVQLLSQVQLDNSQ